MTVTPAPITDLSLYIPDLKPKKKDAALAEMVARAHASGAVREPALLVELLRVREKIGVTALGKGVAVPHARSVTVMRPQLVVARALKGIDWGAPDDVDVTLILLALSPAEWSGEAHHAFLGRAVAAARLQKNRQKLLAASTLDDLTTVLREAGA